MENLSKNLPPLVVDLDLIAKKRQRSLNRKHAIIGLSFIAPNFIGFMIFVLVPIIFSFVLSFSSWDGVHQLELVGFSNFIAIFSNALFLNSLANTFIFAVCSVIITTVVSLGLALLVSSKIKAKNFFRSAFFFPYVASVMACAIVWNNMFQPDFGPINELIKSFGVTVPPRWFASTSWAMSAAIFVNVWKNMGYFMIIYLAGLMNINPSLYEAAKIDGSSSTNTFFKITLPMLAPSTFFVVMMLTINNFKNFDFMYALTQGGPGSATLLLSQYIYDTTFVDWNYGRASAASMILFLIILIITIAQFKAEKKFTV